VQLTDCCLLTVVTGGRAGRESQHQPGLLPLWSAVSHGPRIRFPAGEKLLQPGRTALTKYHKFLCENLKKKGFYDSYNGNDFTDVSKERFNANIDQHASGVPANPLQSWALPQPLPLLQQPCLCTCLTMSINLLTGVPISLLRLCISNSGPQMIVSSVPVYLSQQVSQPFKRSQKCKYERRKGVIGCTKYDSVYKELFEKYSIKRHILLVQLTLCVSLPHVNFLCRAPVRAVSRSSRGSWRCLIFLRNSSSSITSLVCFWQNLVRHSTWSQRGRSHCQFVFTSHPMPSYYFVIAKLYWPWTHFKLFHRKNMIFNNTH